MPDGRGEGGGFLSLRWKQRESGQPQAFVQLPSGKTKGASTTFSSRGCVTEFELAQNLASSREQHFLQRGLHHAIWDYHRPP